MLQIHQLRAAVIERQHIHAEAGLQRRQREELREHHVRHRVFFHFDHHAHARFIGLIAQIGNAFDFLFVHQLGDAFNHVRFIHLIRHFGHDNRPFAGANFLNFRFASHDDRAAARGKPAARAVTA